MKAQKAQLQKKNTKEAAKIRYAVIGLGHIAQTAVLPAFARAIQNSQLVALVSGDTQKLKVLPKKYDAPFALSYRDLPDLLNSKQIDAVYIALPNHLHKEATIKAALAGKHILCEKPMAMNTRDCQEMRRVCADNGVKLMIGYRLHFQKANMEAVQLVQSRKIGWPKYFHSAFSMQVIDRNNIRLDAKGGGPLFDIGIYCINAARYIFQDEPECVTAIETSDPADDRFSEVSEMVSVSMRFPENRLAQFTCSFGAADQAFYEVVGTKGRMRVDSAYEYAEEMKLTLSTGKKEKIRTFSKSDQFAAELEYFSKCIQSDKNPEPSGKEGLADVRVLNAIEESLRSRRTVFLAPFEKSQRPNMGQVIEFPGIKSAPKTMKAAAPHA